MYYLHSLHFTRSRLPLAALSLIISFVSVFAQAQERVGYVSDVLYVPMRSGPGVEFRIVNKGVRSGTQLQVLESSEDNSWTKVVTAAETEGWMRTQYVLSERPAKLQLVEQGKSLVSLRKKNSKLKAENIKFKTENEGLLSGLGDSDSRTVALEQELNSLKERYASEIDLDNEHRKLLEEHKLLRTNRDSLVAENERLKNDKTLSYMFYGAGLLILGMLLSIILPLLKPKSRHSDWA
ncbi:MAG: hypothetical protein COA42_13005 [Alteromonadaceae bacterium]|nr:MAG: hypothetical protein COA42_13005 [Alteromonadaceae bacterium]